jgi:hypothetical protein
VRERGGARRFVSPELDDEMEGEDITTLAQDESSTDQDEK